MVLLKVLTEICLYHCVLFHIKLYGAKVQYLNAHVSRKEIDSKQDCCFIDPAVSSGHSQRNKGKSEVVISLNALF